MWVIFNFIVMVLKDEVEFQCMLVICLQYDGFMVLWILWGFGEGVLLMEEGWELLLIGCGELLWEGDDLMILVYGLMVVLVFVIVMFLEEVGFFIIVINVCFLRFLDQVLIYLLVCCIFCVVIMEEGVLFGGFGVVVLELLIDQDINVLMLCIGIFDQLVDYVMLQQSKEVFGLIFVYMVECIFECFSNIFGDMLVIVLIKVLQV